MRVLQGVAVLYFAAFGFSASSWTFDDATLTVQGKAAGVGGSVKEKLSAASVLPAPVTLGSSDTLKIALTTLDGKKATRPHQAFLTLRDSETGLEESFAFSVKENGKGKVEVTQKDLPFQFVQASKPAEASIVIGSFGSSTPFQKQTFKLNIAQDSAAPVTIPEPPERYAAKEEIHHKFGADPKSPPRIISLVFTAAVLTTLPVLIGAWSMLGGNAAHIGKAFSNAPIAHALFLGSIFAMEGVFFLYYVSWNLFQTLPVAAVVGVVAYVSGSRALTEVQERRNAGER